MTYNLRVKTFVAGATTFETGASQGCYVMRGSADGPRIVNRMVELPTGAIHDLDGTSDAARTPPVVWQEFSFRAANPAGHTQYRNLVAMVGKHGTLTMGAPGAAGETTVSVAARLLPLKGTWEAPFRQGSANELVIRAEWQLKQLL